MNWPPLETIYNFATECNKSIRVVFFFGLEKSYLEVGRQTTFINFQVVELLEVLTPL